MADLFPKPFPNANLSRAIVSPAIQKARPLYRIHFLPDSFPPAFSALLAMELWTSSPIRLPLLFDNSAGSGTRCLQPHQAVEPTVPELGMLNSGAAVYITHISKENDHRAIRHLHGMNNCEVRHRRLIPSLVSTDRRCTRASRAISTT